MMKLSRGPALFVITVMVSGSRTCPENCKKIPSRSICNTVTGTCSRGCVTGNYGNTCNLTCDVNCKQGTCQQRDGLCICRPGYTFNAGSCDSRKGVTCESNDHCVNNTCLSARRPNCLEGCKPGWYGEFCQRSCSPHCNCDREQGNCTSCIPGWYGAGCGSQCSPNCADRMCDWQSGICTSCIRGWYGAECGSRCSPGCVDKNCHRNGTCVGGCMKKYIGKKCESACPEECHDDQCDKNGTCNTCKPGLYGTSCHQTCHRCTDQVCEKITGECFSGCQSGFYGGRCTKTCSVCTDGACNQTTGACTKGCQSGYFGPDCTEKCEMCINGVCNQTTGACTKGCQSGHYGSFCSQTCEDCLGGECDQDTGECSVESNSVQSWVGGGVAFVILIIIIAVGIYVSRRLKRIQGVVYNIEKRRRSHSYAEQDVRPVAAQGYFELEEQVTITPRRVCPKAPIRQTSYIEPRHSGNFGNLQIQPQLQADGVSDQQNDEPQGAGVLPSDILLQNVRRRSDECSERPDSYVLPHYCEVNEEGMATPPNPTQGAQAPTSEVKANLLSVAADVLATRGKIRIPPIAECFGPTGSEDSSPDLQPLVENYDHLNRKRIPRISGGVASSSTQDDDKVRVSLAALCQMGTARPDDYIEPGHSGCIIPPQQQMLSSGASEQQEDEPQASGALYSDRLLHYALIAEVPQPAQGAEAPGHGADNSSLCDVADEDTI